LGRFSVSVAIPRCRAALHADGVRGAVVTCRASSATLSGVVVRRAEVARGTLPLVSARAVAPLDDVAGHSARVPVAVVATAAHRVTVRVNAAVAEGTQVAVVRLVELRWARRAVCTFPLVAASAATVGSKTVRNAVA